MLAIDFQFKKLFVLLPVNMYIIITYDLTIIFIMELIQVMFSEKFMTE